MNNTKVTLAPLEAGDREQFILDNQAYFKYGAVEEFGLRDHHFEEDGEIISRATIEQSIDAPDSEAYRILYEGRKVGGISIIAKTAARFSCLYANLRMMFTAIRHRTLISVLQIIFYITVQDR